MSDLPRNFRGLFTDGRLTDIRSYSDAEDWTNTVELLDGASGPGPWGYDAGTKLPVSLTIGEDSIHSDEVSTSSTTYTPVPGLSMVLDDGSYQVHLSMQLDLEPPLSRLFVALFLNGVMLPASESRVARSLGSLENVLSRSFPVEVTQNDSTLDVRWKVGNGSAIVLERMLVTR